VRDFLKPFETPAIWLLFFATTVYGHVALKVAVNRTAQDEARRVLSALGDVWGWSACAAWGASCLLWMLALSRHRLVFANGLSSLRYVLIALAAWALLGERMTWPQLFGMALITAGLLLVR
jgi:drug/metabolite transporter (DMT)-like permease